MMLEGKGKTAVVTGAGGQDGSYLCELLLSKGYIVYGIVRPSPRDERRNLRACAANLNFSLYEGDLCDPALAYDLASTEPNEFYHLGALSHVGKSFDAATATMETNVGFTSRILDALWKLSPKTRFYHAGSSEMMPRNDPWQGHSNDWRPSSGGILLPWQKDAEDARLGAHSPYAVSKVAAHLLTKVYREAHGMFAVGGIAYNHESPRRPPTFVTQKIVQGVRKFTITGEPVTLGNVDAMRDWHHARDTVKGMWLSLQANEPGEYVFASGTSRTVKEFGERVCQHFGVKYNEAITTHVSETRPLDVPFLLGDPSRAERELKWNREYGWEGLVFDMCRAAERGEA